MVVGEEEEEKEEKGGKGRRRKSPGRSSSPFSKKNIYSGALEKGASIQVFWPSRAASYAGTIVEIVQNMGESGETSYRIHYTFDQTTRAYVESDLRARIYEGVRFALFMKRFVGAIESAVTNQRTVFNVVLNSVEDLFVALDRNNDGKVDASELKELLNRIGFTTNELECNEFLSLIDSDQSGHLDLIELARVVKKQRKTARQTDRQVDRQTERRTDR